MDRMKQYKIIKKLSRAFALAAEQTARAVLEDYRDIQGREEEITGRLRGEFNRHFLKQLEINLGGFSIPDCELKLSTFKKRQEHQVGADFAVSLKVTCGSICVSKAFLVQAKVGRVVTSVREDHEVGFYSSNILQQVDRMLEFTSDSFVFIYYPYGITCIPAFQVKLGNSSKVTTEEYPSHKIGPFFEEFFKCFIGDHKISPSAMGITSLEEYAEKLSAANVIQLEVRLEGDVY